MPGAGAPQSVPQRKPAGAVTEPGLRQVLSSRVPPWEAERRPPKKRSERALPPGCRRSQGWRTLKPPGGARRGGARGGVACRKCAWRKACWGRKWGARYGPAVMAAAWTRKR